MANRKTGYCPICDSNVVHGRIFENRIAYRLDRLSLGVLAWFDLGPWRCVDCGNRQMRIYPRRDARRRGSEQSDKSQDHQALVGNYLRTSESLVHSVVDADRFSEKYRAGVVRKILAAKIPLSRICTELSVSELEVQRWIRAWLESELGRMADSSPSLPAADNEADELAGDEAWSTPNFVPLRVIESIVVQRKE